MFKNKSALTIFSSTQSATIRKLTQTLISSEKVETLIQEAKKAYKENKINDAIAKLKWAYLLVKNEQPSHKSQALIYVLRVYLAVCGLVQTPFNDRLMKILHDVQVTTEKGHDDKEITDIYKGLTEFISYIQESEKEILDQAYKKLNSVKYISELEEVEEGENPLQQLTAVAISNLSYPSTFFNSGNLTAEDKLEPVKAKQGGSIFFHETGWSSR